MCSAIEALIQISLPGENAYHRDRYNAMARIEGGISELGGIFRQLASLVAEQGEVIMRLVNVPSLTVPD